MNDAAIQIILTVMLMVDWMERIMDGKGVFLNGEFHNGEDLYLIVPEGMKHHYKNNEVLKLNKMIYGLKQ